MCNFKSEQNLVCSICYFLLRRVLPLSQILRGTVKKYFVLGQEFINAITVPRDLCRRLILLIFLALQKGHAEVPFLLQAATDDQMHGF